MPVAYDPTLKLYFLICWWLVRGTLLMEWGLLHDFFGNFSTRGERYYFGWREAREVRMCMQGACEVTFSGGGGHMRWEYVCEVRMCTRGENVYARWLWMVEGGMRGENMYARWECVCEVTLNGGWDTRGENMYARWECVCEVRTCMRGDFEGWRGQLYTDP